MLRARFSPITASPTSPTCLALACSPTALILSRHRPAGPRRCARMTECTARGWARSVPRPTWVTRGPALPSTGDGGSYREVHTPDQRGARRRPPSCAGVGTDAGWSPVLAESGMAAETGRRAGTCSTPSDRRMGNHRGVEAGWPHRQAGRCRCRWRTAKRYPPPVLTAARKEPPSGPPGARTRERGLPLLVLHGADLAVGVALVDVLSGGLAGRPSHRAVVDEPRGRVRQYREQEPTEAGPRCRFVASPTSIGGTVVGCRARAERSWYPNGRAVAGRPALVGGGRQGDG
jgi:hypothetical protein